MTFISGDEETPPAVEADDAWVPHKRDLSYGGEEMRSRKTCLAVGRLSDELPGSFPGCRHLSICI